MNRNTKLSSPLSTALRRAAATALLLGSLGLTSCAELATALNTAAQGYATYQQTRVELEQARAECRHTAPVPAPQPPAVAPTETRRPYADPVAVFAAELARVREAQRR